MPELEAALVYSASNRPELEKVLARYSVYRADSQKLRAAEFLISNMPGHYGYSGSYIERYKYMVDSIYKDSLPYYLRKVISNLPPFYPGLAQKLDMQEDIFHIKGDYLIRHIDHAFDVWKKSPWLSDMTYSDFESYLLPYRVDREVFDEKEIDESIKAWNAMMRNADLYEYIRNYLCQFVSFMDVDLLLRDSKFTTRPMMAPDSVIGGYNIDCVQASYYYQYFFHLHGVPSAIDFVPHWAHVNGRHYWNTVIDPFCRHNVKGWIMNSLTPKVYRITYAHQSIPDRSRSSVDYIPLLFRTPFLKDITSEYIDAVDVGLKVNDSEDYNPSYIYLAVFNSLKFEPVAWSEVRNGRAFFRDMGRGVMYYPVTYKGKRQIFDGYPFTLTTSGEKREIIPDTTRRQTLRIRRKYPLHAVKILWSHNMVRSRFEASNDPDFRQRDTLYTLPYNPDLNYVRFKVESPMKYRYWRYVENYSSYISEFALFDGEGNRIQGKPFSHDRDTSGLARAFDDNVFTHYPSYSWFGIDAGKPVSVSEIGYAPLSDDNGIVPGEEYELFWYSGKGWESLGRKVAEDLFIEYDGVPVGGLYWLRNLTKGKEERVFTWERGQQRFW